MNAPTIETRGAAEGGYVAFSLLTIGAVSTAAIIAVFLIAGADTGAWIKFTALAAIAAVNLTVIVLASRRAAAADVPTESKADAMTALEFLNDDQNKMLALDDANDFFGGALKPADMFRLVSSRVAELIPFDASVIFVQNEQAGEWTAAFAEGRRAELARNLKIGVDRGLAGRVGLTGSITEDIGLELESDVLPTEFVERFRTAVALPMVKDGEVFASFQFYRKAAMPQDSETKVLLEKIAARLSPLFASSIAFERSLSNAMTDSLTTLPNERAFFMVLENQLAESQRYRDDRPLTVIAVDVQNFDELNLSYGHAIGNRALTFVADMIKRQLRKMDFLARSINDEFVMILPNAAESTALEVIDRIRSAFDNEQFVIEDDESVELRLNFGSATFWQDGETAPILMQTAQLRKQRSKADDSGKVLWFPREYVN